MSEHSHLIVALKQIAELDRVGLSGVIARRALEIERARQGEAIVTMAEVKEIFRAVRGRSKEFVRCQQ